MVMDWLSQLFDLMPVRGSLDIRCSFGAPWNVVEGQAAKGEIPYHIIVQGKATLDDPAGREVVRLSAGDILLLPGGAAHFLHDGSGKPPSIMTVRHGMNLVLNENSGAGDRLDMLCGRFKMASFHARVLARYLPDRLIVRTANMPIASAHSSRAGVAGGGAFDMPCGTGTENRLTTLINLMRAEADNDALGGRAMLNAYSAALFTLALRLASETADAPVGILALAGRPRLAPALNAMLDNPGDDWTLPRLARLCNMSRATLVRHFQELLGYSATDLLLEIRMMLAANNLANNDMSTGTVADLVGYQSEAAFQRAFKKHMGMTPAQWRRKDRGSVT